MRFSAFLFLCLSCFAAHAWPEKPVRIVVAYPPGGGIDVLARQLADKLAPTWGQPVVVENKPGANTIVAADAVAKSDHHTILMTTDATFSINPHLYAKLPYDAQRDFVPVTMLVLLHQLLVAHPALPANTLDELIKLAKAKPGSINYASSGQGSVIHLATELFASMAGIKLNHIPYKGTGPAMTDLLGGQTDVFFSSTAAAMPHVQAAKLRALAVTTARRIPALPNVPTVAEAALPGYDVTLWHGLIGPKALPREVVERVNAEVTKALKLKETAELLQSDGVAPAGGTPAEFHAVIRKEIDVWRKVAADANVKVE
jgi:tripartite-type tricarboxylate transporter receptor subunit TctC